jgi:hypothetical protein
VPIKKITGTRLQVEYFGSKEICGSFELRYRFSSKDVWSSFEIINV